MTTNRKIRRPRLIAAASLATITLLASLPAQAEGLFRIRERLAERRAEQAEAKPNASERDQSFVISIDGRQRAYLVHLPRGYQPGPQKVPLVLALHGGGGDMEHMARDELYGLKSKSDEAGFIVVFPNGIGALHGNKLATWNAGNCCAKARDEKVNDVKFIRNMVAQLQQRYAVDQDRVFAIGMSNGGMMSYRLACEAADMLKGIMSVAGTDNTQTCQPSRPVAVLHVHARDDDHVLFNGGAGNTFRDPKQVTNFTSVPDTIRKWTRLNHTSTAPVQVLSTPGASCERYTATASGAPVQLCVTDTGGHSWPGGTKPRGDAPSNAISANDVMWAFFSQL